MNVEKSMDNDYLLFKDDEIEEVKNIVNDDWMTVDMVQLKDGRFFRGRYDKEEKVFKTKKSDERSNINGTIMLEPKQNKAVSDEQAKPVSEDENISGWLKPDYKFSHGSRGQVTNGALRAKNYTVVVYPEDLPCELQKDDLWLNCFKDLKFHLVVSPLHDKDVNSDGSSKKAHRHLLIMGKKQWINLSDLKEMVLTQFQGKGVAVPQKCSSTDGMIRYFSHIDNPEKYQYSKDDILCFNGANIDNAYKMSSSEKDNVIFEILEFLMEHDEISNYFQLVEYAMRLKQEGNSLWFDTILSSSWVLERYISSRRNHLKDLEKEKKERNEDKQQTYLMSLNTELVENNLKCKETIGQMESLISLLVDQVPEVANYVQLENEVENNN